MGRAIILVVWLGLLGGCSSFGAPTVQVVDAAVLDVSDQATQVGITLELANPNREPLELEQFDYQLAVGSTVVFRGRRSAQATLNRRSPRRITLPAVLVHDQLGWSADARPAAISFRLSGRLLYVTPGELAEILLDTGLRRPTLRFIADGELPLDS